MPWQLHWTCQCGVAHRKQVCFSWAVVHIWDCFCLPELWYVVVHKGFAWCYLRTVPACAKFRLAEFFMVYRVCHCNVHVPECSLSLLFCHNVILKCRYYVRASEFAVLFFFLSRWWHCADADQSADWTVHGTVWVEPFVTAVCIAERKYSHVHDAMPWPDLLLHRSCHEVEFASSIVYACNARCNNSPHYLWCVHVQTQN